MDWTFLKELKKPELFRQRDITRNKILGLQQLLGKAENDTQATFLRRQIEIQQHKLDGVNAALEKK